MKLIITENYEEMSEATASIVLGEMIQQGHKNISLTSGNTPKRMYELLIPKVKDKDYFSNVHYFNFDELEIEGSKHGITFKSLDDAYYSPANISNENIHELTPTNYPKIMDYIDKTGGLDLILMGIGLDGHFCGNLPGTPFGNDIYEINLRETDEMYQMLKEYMNAEPGYKGVTFGPQTVMNSKKLVLFANGKEKADIIKQALEGPITENVPSSILRLHPNLTVVLDKEAASLLSQDFINKK